MSLVAVSLASILAAASVTGSGVAKTEKRPLEAFASVAAAGALQVDVAVGDKPGCEVTADDNVLALIVTEVKGGVLSIHPKEHADFTAKTPIVIQVAAQKLDGASTNGSTKLNVADVPAGKALALALHGSGALTWKGPAEAVTAAVDGSGAATLNGKGASVAATVNGSGGLDASAFEVGTGSATVNGSGHILVNATTAVDATINGSGTVTTSGAGKVKKSIHGSGTVKSPGDAKAAPKPAETGGGW